MRAISCWKHSLAVSLALLPCLGACADEASQSQLRLSDRLRWLPAAGAAAYSAYRHDGQGMWQLAGEFGATLVATQALKEAFNDTAWGERPDGGENSFPSGHAAMACTGGAYLGERYGWEYSAPAYAVAGYVAHIRVHEDRHHMRDVIAGCALAYGLSRLIVEPFRGQDLSLTPMLGPQALGLVVEISW